ncbi:hypothetical protein Syun_006210 [Stephania yunnanensis]|uniref:Uncharacterized protein n=1 Tax=Stephania yunnanensis TaxID=152371 RepID=A0AAP0KZJ9_9MAGN
MSCSFSNQVLAQVELWREKGSGKYDTNKFRKKWLTCHLFKFNSATLAILAVAAKLPVDLTSSMPSALDQLSKLTGTAFICICMAFLMPSPGLTSFSESISNMISLTIFVITVLINVCTQMRTGVKQITS